MALVLGWLWVVALEASADGTRCATEVASVRGGVEVREGLAGTWVAATPGQNLCAGAQLRVGQAARATLVFRPASGGRAYLRLREGTVLTLPGASAPGDMTLGLEPAVDGEAVERGALHFISRTRRKVRVKTPFVNAYVEGTEVAVGFSRAARATDVTVLEGCALVTRRELATGPKAGCSGLAGRAGTGDLVLERFETARTVSGSGPPVRRLDFAPRDAVAWSLYYPPLPGPKGHAAVERLLLAGEADAALARLDALGPRGADYHALRAVILLVRGDVERAQAAAEAALAVDPRSPRARLARSYVHQARGEIPQALTAAEAAAAAHPDGSFGWARVAELRLAVGDRSGAQAAAAEALRLEPGSVRALTVVGFARLAGARHAAAAARFRAAILRDPAAPLPRLGLGLALIRGGGLAAGRELLELAAILAPGDAVTRSYLGKAYMEEGRLRLARDQLDIATEVFASRDPTPWFYRALLEARRNAPVKALRDLEAAVARNDNRLVQRSRLLLDEDAAVRATGTARIYQELGFTDRALLEGTRALMSDPASHTAHRFMADVQATRRRHEIGRTSELLQSQLLQPVHLHPIQPRLAETNLLVLEGSGPVSVSTGEYHPLFSRNQTLWQLAGVAGSQDTFGNEATVTALHDGFVLSLTQYHYRNDGFRENQDVEHDIATGFLQVDVSPATSVQLEARRRRTESGDRAQRINPGDFFPGQRRAVESDTLRVGLRHAPGPATTLLATAARQWLDEPVTFRLRRPDLGLSFDSEFNRPAEADQLDLRLIHQFEGASLDTGAGYQYQDSHFRGRVDVTVLAAPFLSPPPRLSFEDLDSRHANAYAYLNGTAGRELHWTLGMGVDDSGGAPRDRTRFSPKLGVLWDVAPGLSTRAAAFRGVRRPVIGDRVLEPTQIAGFDQFFDDPYWSWSEAWGAGVDYHSGPVSAGGSLFRRDITTLNVDSRSSRVFELERREDVARLYAGAALTDRVSFSASLEYEALEREPGGGGSRPLRIDTRTLPLALRWFHPDGLRASVELTGVDQDVDFAQPNPRQDASAHFWVTDLRLEKDLPGRSGFLYLTGLNLLDRDFGFQDTDFDLTEAREPRYAEELSIFLGVSLVVQ